MSRDGELDDPEALYDDSWQRKITTRPERPKRVRDHQNWLARMAPYRRSGRLFEVGAGKGAFLKTAADAGWAAQGNDISKVAAEHARKISGVHVIHGPVETVDLVCGAYDVILCNNVFEHLADPRRVLCKLADALRPGGVLFLQTLCAQSLSLWFQAAGWIYYGRGHLHIPTLVSLKHYFTCAGLGAIHFETHGFRSSATQRYKETRERRRRIDKLMSGLAARVSRGHRVKYLLEKLDAG